MNNNNEYLYPQVSSSLHHHPIHNSVEMLLHHHPDMAHYSSIGDVTPSANFMPNTSHRKPAVKKDRHSKIFTAQGPRDRRVRLSKGIARKFFDLQEMLGFEKPSKTLDWLLTKSRTAIRDLLHTKQGNEDNLSDKTCKASEKQQAKESRAKARARARERTREKMSIRNNNNLNPIQVFQSGNLESNTRNSFSGFHHNLVVSRDSSSSASASASASAADNWENYNMFAIWNNSFSSM